METTGSKLCSSHISCLYVNKVHRRIHLVRRHKLSVMQASVLISLLVFHMSNTNGIGNKICICARIFNIAEEMLGVGKYHV